MSSIIVSFFSSFVSTVHADAPSDQEQQPTKPAEEVKPAAEAAEPAAEEESDPEDSHPLIRKECGASAKCAALTKHFEHCQEKVHSGQGFKGEDCVEELFHMMHCVDKDAAPKLFAQLR